MLSTQTISKFILFISFVFVLFIASNITGYTQTSRTITHPTSPITVNGNLYDISINYAKKPDLEGFLIQLSPYNDFINIKNGERVVTPSTNKILKTYNLIRDFNNVLYLNKDTVYTFNTEEKNKVTVIKDYKTNKETLFIKNGVKFEDKDIVFDEAGNFFSQSADNLDKVTTLTGKRYFYNSEKSFVKSRYLGILKENQSQLIIVKNSTLLPMEIDPKNNLVFVSSPAYKDEQVLTTKLEIYLIQNPFKSSIDKLL